MIGIDTHVLVRYLTQDDAAQARAANNFFAGLSSESPGFVSTTVLVETLWVLQSAYRADKAVLVKTLDELLHAKGLHIEQADIVWKAYRRFAENNVSFADCLIERVGHAHGCTHTVSFDTLAVRHAGMKLLK